MGMFDTYDNLNPYYIPNNTSRSCDNVFGTIDNDLPRPLIDLKGRQIGYTWNNGELFDFNLSVNDIITVREDAIIYDTTQQAPTEDVVGIYEGQKAYNVVDGKSWTFVGTFGGLFIWVEDSELLFPLDGEKNITIYTDMTNKYIKLDIYSFRWELIHSIQNDNNDSNITLKVDKELSKKLIPGLYYATLNICSETSQFLKSKFKIAIN